MHKLRTVQSSSQLDVDAGQALRSQGEDSHLAIRRGVDLLLDVCADAVVCELDVLLEDWGRSTRTVFQRVPRTERQYVVVEQTHAGRALQRPA